MREHDLSPANSVELDLAFASWPLKPTLPRIKTRSGSLSSSSSDGRPPTSLLASPSRPNRSFNIRMALLLSIATILTIANRSFDNTAVQGDMLSNDYPVNTSGEKTSVRSLREATYGSNNGASLYASSHQRGNTGTDAESRLPACLELYPWELTAPQTAQLSYLGLYNDLEALLQQQSRPFGKNGLYVGVSVIFYEGGGAPVLQDLVNSFLHSTKACNYFVAAWSKGALQTCLDLNLPCLNASMLLPPSTAPSSIGWRSAVVKPAVASAILDRGFGVHIGRSQSSASDPIAFMYKTTTDVNADASIVVHTNTPSSSFSKTALYAFDTTTLMVLPSPGGRILAAKWLEATAAGAVKGETSSQALGRLYQTGSGFDLCKTVADCQTVKENAAMMKASSGISKRQPLVRHAIIKAD